jgi:hypothetical protein
MRNASERRVSVTPIHELLNIAWDKLTEKMNQLNLSEAE